MMLAIGTEYALACWQLDYITAFLSDDVMDDVRATMILMYDECVENGVPLILRLLKRLYGLRQSPTNWWNMIAENL
ncbi:unnamed protein product [Laminaria digitata]